jgi:hypothetical protein
MVVLLPFSFQRNIGPISNSVMSGHLGKKKTKGKLSQRYYWYEMRENLSFWISQCETCEENKPPETLQPT